MTAHRFLALAALCATPALTLTGCGGTESERAVKDVAGVEEGRETRTADVKKTQYIHETIDRIRDGQTGEVVGERTRTTPVVVEEKVEVERATRVDAGETTTETRGFVPEGLPDR